VNPLSDIFTPTTKQPKELTRKDILKFLVICVLLSYVLSEYILINVTKISVHTITGNEVSIPIKINVLSGEDKLINYLVRNYSPYKVRITIEYDNINGINITTNGNILLGGKTEEYIWIKVVNSRIGNEMVSVNIGGKKIG